MQYAVVSRWTSFHHGQVAFISRAPVCLQPKLSLMQFFKPENYVEVRQALLKAGRGDLIGNGCDALIPSTPPRAAIVRRHNNANERFTGEYVHTVPSVEKGTSAKKQSRHQSGTGYRPKRKSTSAPGTRR